jgi:hypothetical protein
MARKTLASTPMSRHGIICSRPSLIGRESNVVTVADDAVDDLLSHLFGRWLVDLLYVTIGAFFIGQMLIFFN